MFKIAIVEDNEEEAKTLSSFIERFSRENYLPFKTVAFKNPISLLEDYTADYDMIFLDIRMPYMNGMEAAHRIRALDPDVLIVFVTSLAQYAIAGYEVDALDFIVKPIRYYDFALKFQRAIARLHTETKIPEICVSTRNGKLKLSLDDILYIEAENHHIIYHTLKGNFTEYNTMKETESKLAPYGFSRCNNCYLVHLKYVTMIRGYTVFIGEEQLQISQPRKKDFARSVIEYTEGK